MYILLAASHLKLNGPATLRKLWSSMVSKVEVGPLPSILKWLWWMYQIGYLEYSTLKGRSTQNSQKCVKDGTRWPHSQQQILLPSCLLGSPSATHMSRNNRCKIWWYSILHFIRLSREGGRIEQDTKQLFNNAETHSGIDSMTPRTVDFLEKEVLETEKHNLIYVFSPTAH